MFDEQTIKQSVQNMLLAIGEDPEREGLKETPRRVAQMYAELFSGMNQDPAEVLRVGYELGHREMVIIKDIPFYSMCEHHLLPFSGVVHIGYIPNIDGRVVGISKLARVVEIYAKRPQIQERMATQIADAIIDGLKCDGVAVVIEAEHMCMVMRGIKKPGSRVITSALRGSFHKSPAARAEFLSLIQQKH
ncbi:MAG: GTP cyclohydrolase I FolE [Dehalococcoides mccartyi]|uniref:GTP cyclohydrolase I FolE n=1 Tax=Dehalococcoides TaxID=61434 RepID=UPI0030FA7C2D